jgi:hypothetical protein
LALELFPGSPRPPSQSNKGKRLSAFVTSSRLGTINPIPIGYGSRPRLRGPAHPARINLAQEPLDLRRQSFSLCLSLLMSAFSLPIPPATLARHLQRPTERSATTSEDRRQWTVDRRLRPSVRRSCGDPAASWRARDTRLAIAATSPDRYSRDRGNSGSTPASPRSSQSLSPGTV